MQTKHLKIALAFVVTLFSASACQQYPKEIAQSQSTPVAQVENRVNQLVQAERDEIYSLLAYAVVLKDWQSGGPNKRGHNIGSVLVDQEGEVVFWARNSNSITGNGTQHGEVRLMIGYLNKVQSYSLKNYTIYTSLEPCAMCSGMMTLQSITRTVYGQEDPGFGKAIERLELDTHKLPEQLPTQYKKGYRPYPRGVISDPSKSIIYKKLNDAYQQVGGSITKFLLSDAAKAIYQEALELFLSFQVKHPENKSIIKNARDFLNGVSDHYSPLKPKI